MKKKVLVLCHDVLGKKMAGPGMRYSKVAEILGKKYDVTLGVFSEANKGGTDAIVINPDSDDYKPAFDNTDFIFAQWLNDSMIDYAKSQGKAIIFDLYAPVPIEYLASLEFSSKDVSPQKDEEFGAIIAMYNRYFTKGDVFTCSNERQRDFWTGYVTANGLFKPSNFKQKKMLDNFLICPMGTSVGPKPKEMLLRKKLGLKKDDFVLVWTGGIWDWFDGQLVVQAMAKIKDPFVKLVFLGTKHPNSIYTEEMSETVATRRLAEKLGLTGKSIFFLDGWIPYEERSAYFMDADAAIYADKESLETRFSHRTRVLDHFWMELPTICTAGDYMSDIIAAKEFGVVVGERTADAFASAITNLKADPKAYARIKHNLHDHHAEFSWDKTLDPLVKSLASIKVPLPKVPQEAAAAAPKPLPLKHRVKRSAKMLLLGR